MPAHRSLAFVLLTALAVAVLLLFFAPAAAQPTQGTPPVTAAQAASKAKVVANYGHSPLSFEANRGQTDPSMQFLSRGQGYTLFLRPGEAVLALRSGKRTAAKTALPANPSLATPLLADPRSRFAPNAGEIEISFVRMRLVEANPRAVMHEEDEQITKTNYFIGNDPSKWRTDVPNYGRVRYAGIYPGVDLVYYGNQSRLEHDFVVAPGADPTHIRLALSGAKQMRIDPTTGDLIVSTGNGELRLLKPVAYQRSKGRRTPVSSTYRLLAKYQIGFQVASYNHTQPLVIDPVLVYSTYLGGSGTCYDVGRPERIECDGDQGNGIAVDSSGDAYIVGTTYSRNFPLTSGALQSLNYAAEASNNSTVFVSELNPAGTALVYSSYIGGSNSDFGYAIGLDASNNVYIAGATYSVDFPATCGSFQSANPSKSEATSGFVVKLNPAGDGLVYSTFLGGEGDEIYPARGDVVQALAVDPAGDVYLTGYTWSANFPTTEGAFQTEFAGSTSLSNAFVTKLNPGGTGLLYSSFLGGSGSKYGGDYGNAIAIDSSGDAYVAGSTASANFPVTKGALQTALTGPTNAFVTELNPGGTDEVYSTYLGGSGGDSAQAIALDSNGNVYVAGDTSSGDFPLTDGVLESASSGIAKYVAQYGNYGFVTKLNLSSSALQYSTIVEGQGTSVTGLAVDSSGSAYLTGTAPAPSAGVVGGFQLTPDSLATPPNQGNSPFVVKLDPSAAELQYATLFGGSGSDGPLAMALDASRSVYLTGFASSTNFPTTTGAFQAINNASTAKTTNAFVSKLALAGETNQVSYPSLPSSISTSIVEDSAQWEGGDFWILDVDLTLVSATPGPPPGGTLSIYQTPPPPCQVGNCVVGIAGIWTESSKPMNLFISYPEGGGGGGAVYAEYSGDAIYQPSSLTFTPPVGYCASNPCPCGYAPCTGVVRKKSSLRTANSTPSKPKMPQAKFTPSPAMPQQDGSGLRARPSLAAHAEATCLSTHAVDVFLINAMRLYGSENPQFIYKLSGLPSGFGNAVTPFSTATLTSPVGAYPISATVSAPPYDLIHVYEATLQVNKAPLTVVPLDAYQLAGIAPAAFSYELTGFRNNDTASVVSGKPILASTAGDAPRAGNYAITARPGTLNAENYRFLATTGELDVFAPIDLGATAPAPSYSFYHWNIGAGPASTVCGGSALEEGQAGGVFRFWQSSSLPTPSDSYFGDIDFGPSEPGLYIGGMQIFGNCSTSPPTDLLVSIPLYGEGVSPLSVFDPGPQAIVQPIGSAMLESPQAVAVDGNGALYIADAGADRVIKVAGNSKTVLSLGKLKLKSPGAVAIDGVGNLDIADTGNNRIVQFTIGGKAHVVPLDGRTLAGPRALIVDRTGDLLIADTGHNRIVEVKANGIVSNVSTGILRLSHPNGVAVDATGDLFIADTGNNRIVKIDSTGAATVLHTGLPALSGPIGIAIDPAGTLYIAETSNEKLIEVLSGGLQWELPFSGLSNPHGIALDHDGVLYIADTGNKRVIELLRNGTPTLTFAKTVEGKESSGGPQEIVVRNIGNAVLSISSVSYPTDFPEDASGKSTNCKAGEALAAAASCTLTIDFKPVAAVTKGSSTLLKESVKITSNTLNKAGTVQTVVVEGTETK